MYVKLLTGPKAGKIADVTDEHGLGLIARNEAEKVTQSGERWPDKKEETPAQPLVVVQPVVVPEQKKGIRKRR